MLLYGFECYFMGLNVTLWGWMLIYGVECYFMGLNVTLWGCTCMLEVRNKNKQRKISS